MFDFFKNLLAKNSVDFKELVKNGAQIIDVRTLSEFENGSIRNSRNIPLQNLAEEIKNLDKRMRIITCCASGVRSASAKQMFMQNGFEVYNGGGWTSLQKKLNH